MIVDLRQQLGISRLSGESTPCFVHSPYVYMYIHDIVGTSASSSWWPAVRTGGSSAAWAGPGPKGPNLTGRCSCLHKLAPHLETGAAQVGWAFVPVSSLHCSPAIENPPAVKFYFQQALLQSDNQRMPDAQRKTRRRPPSRAFPLQTLPSPTCQTLNDSTVATVALEFVRGSLDAD
jgi:hypothetical protein